MSTAPPYNGTVDVWSEWEPIPGTFLELRGMHVRKDLEQLDYEINYGFSPTQDPMRTHGLKLTSHGRVLLDVTIRPEDREAGGIVADVYHLNMGTFTVRFGWTTPLPPAKPKTPQKGVNSLFTDPAEDKKYGDWAAGSAATWAAMSEEERDEARIGTEGERFMTNPPTAFPPLDAENDAEWPDWLKALKAEGFDTEDIKAVLDEEDGYTPKSGRAFVLDEDELDDEREMSESELQQYLARKAEQG